MLVWRAGTAVNNKSGCIKSCIWNMLMSDASYTWDETYDIFGDDEEGMTYTWDKTYDYIFEDDEGGMSLNILFLIYKTFQHQQMNHKSKKKIWQRVMLQNELKWLDQLNLYSNNPELYDNPEPYDKS